MCKGQQYERTSVIICGGGPTGALLSAMLGQMNVANVVLERDPEITTDPRGIVLDEDGIRALQSIGVYDRIFSEIGSCMQKFMFVTGSGTDLTKKPLFAIDNSTTVGGTGHVGFLCHKQPVLERVIRDRIGELEHSSIRPSSTVTEIHEDEDQVVVTYLDAQGQKHEIVASFLVGADGKTGFVRKKYLEPKGVHMERVGYDYDETWVALNWQISLPTLKTHPDFPLWRLGYTPEQVYRLFFPEHFRFLCNPQRPAVCGNFGLPEDRLWRFEFVVKEGEDGNVMADIEHRSAIIHPYITHPGSRYGVSKPVHYPTDCITTLRSRPFSFSARSCNKWSLGRVALVGDAAHVFPPFGGQGIASGFRDALSIAWRLAFLTKNSAVVDHEMMLAAWYGERKQQLNRSLAATLRNGEQVNETNLIKCFWRDWYFWFVQLVPSWKVEIEKGPRALGMTKYEHEPGLPFVPELQGGRQLPQIYVYDTASRKIMFSDTLLFGTKKQALLQYLLLADSWKDGMKLQSLLRETTHKHSDLLIATEATILMLSKESYESDREEGIDLVAVRVANGTEFAQSPLCEGRPKPKYYDASRIHKDFQGAKVIIVRPDRFVYAACSSATELEMALSRMSSALHFKQQGSV